MQYNTIQYNTIKLDAYKVLSDNFITDHTEAQCFDGSLLLWSTWKMRGKMIFIAVTGRGIG